MMPNKIAVYVRVSTDKQDHESQVPDIKRWLTAYGEGREVIWYKDTFTGKTMDRPEMRRLIADIHLGDIHKLVVWRIDRLGRTTVQMLTFLDYLEKHGIAFVSVKDGFDASTPSGRLLRNILVSFAEYEREVISERVRAGIKKAHAAGKRWGGSKPGNPTRLTRETTAIIRALVAAGVSKTEVARQLQMDRSTVYEAVKMIGGAA